MLGAIVDGGRHQESHRDDHQREAGHVARLRIRREIVESLVEHGDRLETEHRLQARKNAARFLDDVAHFLIVLFLLRSLIVHGQTVAPIVAAFNRAHD